MKKHFEIDPQGAMAERQVTDHMKQLHEVLLSAFANKAPEDFDRVVNDRVAFAQTVLDEQSNPLSYIVLCKVMQSLLFEITFAVSPETKTELYRITP